LVLLQPLLIERLGFPLISWRDYVSFLCHNRFPYVWVEGIKATPDVLYHLPSDLAITELVCVNQWSQLLHPPPELAPGQ
jgi:hypothetical protein